MQPAANTDEIKWIVEPWPFQREVIFTAAEKERKGYALFWRMGRGKTFSSLSILRIKYKRAKRVLRTLILCPPVVIENWKREIEKFSHCGDDAHCLNGAGSKKTKTFEENAWDDNDVAADAIFITNYETLLNEQLFGSLRQWRPEVIIYDECHRIKNASAKRTKRAMTLADKADYRLLLSGTPITNSLMDVWAQYKVMDGGATFGKSFAAFRGKYFWDKNATWKNGANYFPNWVPNELMLDDLQAKIAATASVIAHDEGLGLPDLVKKQMFVDLSPEQKRVYKEMQKDFIAFVNDKACVATMAMTKAMRLMQIASGFAALEAEEGKRETVPFKQIPRALVLRELLAELTAHSKCIVWAVFKDNYRTVREVCEDLGVGYVEVHGGVSPGSKQRSIDAFNTDPDTKVFIGNSGSAGIGCNLTSARYAIFYSRNFSLDQDIQAEKRNHRPGCEGFDNLVRIDLIAKDTIDELIAERLAQKQAISDRVLVEVARGL